MKTPLWNLILSLGLFGITLYWMQAGEWTVSKGAQPPLSHTPPQVAKHRSLDRASPSSDDETPRVSILTENSVVQQSNEDNGENPYSPSRVLQTLDAWIPFRSESLLSEYRESQFRNYADASLPIGTSRKSNSVPTESERKSNPYLALQDHLQEEARQKPADFNFEREREQRVHQYLQAVHSF